MIDSVTQLAEHLVKASRLIKKLSDNETAEHNAIWSSVNQAVEHALVMSQATKIPDPVQRVEQLRLAIGSARASVVSGTMAIYQISGSGPSAGCGNKP